MGQECDTGHDMYEWTTQQYQIFQLILPMTDRALFNVGAFFFFFFFFLSTSGNLGRPTICFNLYFKFGEINWS